MTKRIPLADIIKSRGYGAVSMLAAELEVRRETVTTWHTQLNATVCEEGYIRTKGGWRGHMSLSITEVERIRNS